MRRLLPYMSVLLMYLMTPSLGEVVENVAHLVAEGHTAHALHDEAHQPDDPEHGCSGPFHVCSCHTSVAFTAPSTLASVAAPLVLPSDLVPCAEQRRPEGYLDSVFRPPIA